MSKIAVVYWSGTGNTEAMANAVLEGVKEAGAEGELLNCGEFDAEKVADYDADHQCNRKYCWRIHVIKGWTEFRIRRRQEVLWSSLRSSRCDIGNGCRCTGSLGIFDSFILCL